MDPKGVSLALAFWIAAVCPAVCLGHAYADGHDSGTAHPVSRDRSCHERPCLCATSTAADTSAARACVTPPHEIRMLATSFSAQPPIADAWAPEIGTPARTTNVPSLPESIRLLI